MPDVSEPEDVEVTSTPSGVTEERLLELLAANNERLLSDINSGVVEEVATKAAQQWKDRRLGKYETKMEELMDIFAQVDAEGGRDGVIADFQSRQREDELFERLASRVEEVNILPQQRASDANAKWVAEWQAAVQRTKDKLDGAEVEYDPAELQALTTGQFGSATEARDALADYQVAKLTNQPVPVPASAAAIEGGGDAPPTSEEETSPQDNFEDLQAGLAKAVANSGAGSQAAKAAQAEIDTLVGNQMAEYFKE